MPALRSHNREMRRPAYLALAILIIAALPGWQLFRVGCGAAVSSVSQTIASVSLSGNSVASGAPSGTVVGGLSAAMSPSSPPFLPVGAFTLATNGSCTGPQNANYQITGTTNVATLGTATAGTICVKAASSSATNSPVYTPFTITVSAGITVAFTSDNATNSAGNPADTIASLAFPFVTMQGILSEPERVVVFNTNGGSLSGLSIGYSGFNAADFSTAETNCTGTLANNAYCRVIINFTPSTTTPETGNLVFSTAQGNASLSLSGTGQAAHVINATCASLNGATLASNTLYLLGDVTCNQITFHGGNGASIQGDCTAYQGANTILDGQSVKFEITDLLADAIPNFTFRCLTIKNYANDGKGCPDPNNNPGSNQFNTFDNAAVINSTIGPSCGIGSIPHGGGTQTWWDNLVTGNVFAGMFPQQSSGTLNMTGNEWSHNAEFAGAGDCNTGGQGDCANYKLAGNGAVVDTGSYMHNLCCNSANAAWSDVFSGAHTVTGATILNPNGSCIRYETMATPGIFTHNVCITPGSAGIGVYQGAIVAFCGHNFTADFNYVTENAGAPTISQQDATRPDCGGHAYTYEASHNLVVVLTTDGTYGQGSGYRYGANPVGNFGTQTSYASNHNTFYAPSTGQAFISQTVASTNILTLAGAQGTGQETGSTITAGTPGSVPSGCTGDGKYGTGCRGSGM